MRPVPSRPTPLTVPVPQPTAPFLQFIEHRSPPSPPIPTVHPIDNDFPPEITMNTARSIFSRTDTVIGLAALVAAGALMLTAVSDMTRRFDPTPPTVMVQLEPVVITGTAKAKPAVRDAQIQPVVTKLAVAGITTLN